MDTHVLKGQQQDQQPQNAQPLTPDQQLKTAQHLTKGQLGERLAAQYLSELGWQILQRNWRCDQGELDITALEPAEPYPPIAVAVEVKLRTGLGYGDPFESITQEKLQRLRQLAGIWVKELDQPISDLRLDAIAILKLPGRAPQLRHLRALA